MTKKINVSVIGVGRMGGRHARNLLKGRVAGARLCAVCDIDAEALKKFEGVAAFSDYKEMIDVQKPDAVIIATPHYFHGEIAKFCIEKGVNVLVEKPLTVTAAEAKEVIAAAQSKRELVCAVTYNQRTNPLYARARALVQSGALGEIRRINFIVTDWYRSQAYYNQGGWRASYRGEGGGTLINQCVHQLDLLQWICGMPETVAAQCKTVNRDITTENDVTAVFGFKGGANGSFTASTHELRGTNRLEISGDGGRLIVDKRKLTVYKLKKDEKVINAETQFGYGFVTRTKRVYYYRLRFLKDALFGQQINIVRNFVNAIRKKEKLISPIEDGLGAVELINAAYLSSWERRPVTLPIDDGEYEKQLARKAEEELQ